MDFVCFSLHVLWGYFFIFGFKSVSCNVNVIIILSVL